MKKNKHIVIVTTNFANGGTERRAMVLANGFANKGYKVTYLVMNKIYTDVVYKLDDRVSLVNISDFAIADIALKEKNKAKKQIEKKQKWLKAMHRVAKMFKNDAVSIKRKKDILKRCLALRAFIICNPDATFISFGIDNYERVFIASEGLKCKLLFSDASAPQFKKDQKENMLFEKVYSNMLKKADACIFQTTEQKAYYGSSVIRNGYIIKNPLLANLPPIHKGDRKNIVVNFCRTHPVKNLILLVDAFKIFSERFPQYTLEIYGATSTDTAEKYKSEVKKHILDLGLERKVFVNNAITDIHEKIFDYGMYVSSSDSEGLSNSMLEAMAMGLPCVCTDCEGGGAREVIIDGENGLLVPVKNVEAMSEAMCKIAENNQFEEKLSRNAAKIRTELSVDNIVNKWLDVIASN